jgi:(p)ppGpp synthase/HD superfamily hydrolase
MNIVDRARKFAERAHREQVRKYTGEPYFVHLDEVAKLCARFGCNKRTVAAAYLHDTIEDQPVTYEDTGIEPVRPEGLDALAPHCLTARPTLRRL